MNNGSENLTPETEIALQAAVASLQPDMTVEEARGLMETTRKGEVLNIITNAVTVVSYDPLLRGAFRYNDLTDTINVVKPLGWERGNVGAALVNNDIHNVHLYCTKTYGLKSMNLIEEAVKIVANRDRFHPIRDFLNSLEWDGTPRVRYALHHFLGADTSDYTCEVLKTFMLGAISRSTRI